jgi:hypothetical protein
MANGSNEGSTPHETTENEDADLPVENSDFNEEFEAAISRLDQALDSSLSAKDRSNALAALTAATTELNGLFSSDIVVAAPIQIAPDSYRGGNRLSSFTGPSWVPDWVPFMDKRPKSNDDRQKLDDKVQKYWGTVEKLVQKYQPTQYQITIGFPLGVSLTLSWDVAKGTSAPLGST